MRDVRFRGDQANESMLRPRLQAQRSRGFRAGVALLYVLGRRLTDPVVVAMMVRSEEHHSCAASAR
jgi:hypothetical protein